MFHCSPITGVPAAAFDSRRLDTAAPVLTPARLDISAFGIHEEARETVQRSREPQVAANMQRKSAAAARLLMMALVLARSRSGPPNSLFDTAGHHIRDGTVYYLNASPARHSTSSVPTAVHYPAPTRPPSSSRQFRLRRTTATSINAKTDQRSSAHAPVPSVC